MLNSLKILVVDDEERFCRQAKSFLSIDGHLVLTECDGKHVMQRLNEFEPAVVVLDVDLGSPDIDGRTLCSLISKTQPYVRGELRIILISGHYIDPGDEISGFKAGADNYLIKPFEMAQLAARVEAISRRINTCSELNVLEIDEHLSINIPGRIVTMDDVVLDLSRLEFNVLCYLAKSPGVVKTKSDLLEKVWSTTHVEDSAVSKCISLLRKKLSKSNSDLYINTVYGVGYRFVKTINDEY